VAFRARNSGDEPPLAAEAGEHRGELARGDDGIAQRRESDGRDDSGRDERHDRRRHERLHSGC